MYGERSKAFIMSDRTVTGRSANASSVDILDIQNLTINKMGFEMDMTDFIWENVAHEVALRAEVGVDIDESDVRCNRIFASRVTRTFGSESLLYRETPLAVRFRANLKSLDLWDLVTAPGLVRNILEGETSFRQFANHRDPELNAWMAPLILFCYTARKLQNDNFSRAGSRTPHCLGFQASRAEGVCLYKKMLNLCYGTGIIPRVFYGTYAHKEVYKSTYSAQLKRVLAQPCDILVGSPGRFVHVLQSHYRLSGLGLLCIDQVQHFVRADWNDDFFTPLRRLKILLNSTSVYLQGCAISKQSASMMISRLGLPEDCHWIGTKGLDCKYVSRAVTQIICPVKDGPPALSKATDIISNNMLDRKQTLVIAQRRESAAALRRDIVRLLQSRGLTHAEGEIGLLTSDTSQHDNEKILSAFMKADEVKVLIGTEILTEIPDFHVTEHIVWIGSPCFSGDYRNGLVRVFRNDHDKSGVSTIITTPQDKLDIPEIVQVIAEGGNKTLEEAREAVKATSEESEELEITGTASSYVNKRQMLRCHRCSRRKYTVASLW